MRGWAGVSRGDGEKWWNADCILKVKSLEPGDRSAVGSERRSEEGRGRV